MKISKMRKRICSKNIDLTKKSKCLGLRLKLFMQWKSKMKIAITANHLELEKGVTFEKWAKNSISRNRVMPSKKPTSIQNRLNSEGKKMLNGGATCTNNKALPPDQNAPWGRHRPLWSTGLLVQRFGIHWVRGSSHYTSAFGNNYTVRKKYVHNEKRQIPEMLFLIAEEERATIYGVRPSLVCQKISFTNYECCH